MQVPTILLLSWSHINRALDYMINNMELFNWNFFPGTSSATAIWIAAMVATRTFALSPKIQIGFPKTQYSNPNRFPKNSILIPKQVLLKLASQVWSILIKTRAPPCDLRTCQLPECFCSSDGTRCLVTENCCSKNILDQLASWHPCFQIWINFGFDPPPIISEFFGNDSPLLPWNFFGYSSIFESRLVRRP